MYEPIGEGEDSLFSIFTTFNPDIIESDIQDYLTKQKIEAKVDPKKYKIKF